MQAHGKPTKMEVEVEEFPDDVETVRVANVDKPGNTMLGADGHGTE